MKGQLVAVAGTLSIAWLLFTWITLAGLGFALQTKSVTELDRFEWSLTASTFVLAPLLLISLWSQALQGRAVPTARQTFRIVALLVVTGATIFGIAVFVGYLKDNTAL